MRLSAASQPAAVSPVFASVKQDALDIVQRDRNSSPMSSTASDGARVGVGLDWDEPGSNAQTLWVGVA